MQLRYEIYSLGRNRGEQETMVEVNMQFRNEQTFLKGKQETLVVVSMQLRNRPTS